jgi:predicted transcriptional regulator of viral defense system
MSSKDKRSITDNAPRDYLRALARASHGGVISSTEAANALGLSARRTSRILTTLTRAGWLKRLRRGLYLVLPLEAEARTGGVVEDPWILATKLFGPCYIGGWSAAEHWGLTEQIFRPVFVVSASHRRRSKVELGEIEFHVVVTSPKRVESVKPIWRGRERVAVSSPERTIADALVTPSWVGGIRHLAEMLTSYRRESWNPDGLLSELAALGVGAAFKRLGYLVETLGLKTPKVVALAAKRRTSGNVKLDPSIRARGRLLKRWGLWVNAGVGRGETAS